MPLLAAIPLAAVVIALVVLLMLYGYVVFAKTTGQLLPDWHILGFGSIRDYWVGAATSLYNAALHLFHASLAPVADFMRAPVIAVEHLFLATSDFLHEAVSTASWIIHTAIPRAVNSLHTLLNTAIATVAHNAAAALSSTAHNLQVNINNQTAKVAASVSALSSALSHQISQLQANINSQTGTIRTYAAGIVSDLRTDVVGWIDGLQSAVASDINSVRTYASGVANSAASAAVGGLTIDVEKDLAALWPSVTGAVAGVIDAAEGDFADVTNSLRAASRAVPTSIPGAIAAIGALAVPLIKLAEDCTIPNCQNLSQVGRDLQALFGLVEGVAFLELITEAIHDPTGTATEVASEVDSVFGGAARAFSSLVGL